MCSRSRRNPNQRFNPFDSSRPISPNLDELRLSPQRGREGGVRLTSIRLSSHRISMERRTKKYLSLLSQRNGKSGRSVVPCGKMISFSSSPSGSCPVLSCLPWYNTLFSKRIFCKRKRVRGKKKRKGFFSDRKTGARMG